MLNVLLVDDDNDFTDVASQIIEFLGHDVTTAQNLAEAYQILEFNEFDHIFLDFMLPDGSGLHLIDHVKKLSSSPYITMITGHPSVKTMLAGLCGPKVDYLLKPLQREDLESALSRKSAKKKTSNATSAGPTLHFGCLIGESKVMQALYTMIERVAQTPANIMLMGESGVGKEVFAKAIHEASKVKGPLVATNCGALSKELIGSELFGHEKGSFTGAVGRKIGVFERAENGTLFLDEVTEMPLDMQPTLLRVLESKKVVRVGGTTEIDVNCRVVSATNRNLSDLAQSKALREDIYFRLAVFPIDIPPLRERSDDIPLLAEVFLRELNEEYNANLTWSGEQLNKLSAYHWPGNVRELRHAVHRAFIMSDMQGSKVELPAHFESPFAREETKSSGITAGQTIEDVERLLISATLEKVDGNKTLAAEMLGISTKTLYNRLHAYGDFDA
ncbi:MAG: sigma-54 dependent transcriptional regulator [Paraglaciecola sp.]|uniref:sigma-54-dependent transcriptional regulator n=1 Tax=Pseudomonadati TaxID=3379134 RepID=UPI00273F6DCF|nr:sigma-54 dependent transcriptional regulator [Paraglaciecola sp.]MDP5033239.1 sigma-54 dependent transcriptional regulator [Paraglaciecola sp.]MDP5129592.1 sigma-54 dependent transcriptional regulator [Paraglaciecola sp.]